MVPNHLSGEDPASVVAADERAQVAGRAMLVKRLRPLPVEAVVRGYLAGSGWAEYQRSGAVCGVPLPAGLVNASRLSEPIFTPATKAEAGAHDENIDFEQMQQLVGAELADRVREVSLAPVPRGGRRSRWPAASSSPTPSSSSAWTMPAR